MARSTDDGASWTTYDVAKVDGARAFSSGEVVLADGRVLALLADWSDDRIGRLSDRPHGLYVSAGDDWSRYTASTRWPDAQSLQASAENGGVIWVTTSDGRVYASIDQARTFDEIAAR